MGTRLRWSGLILLLAVMGCDRPDQTPPKEAAPSTDDSSEIDRLRALPSANYTEEDADEGQVGVTIHDRDRSYPGYNLYSVRRLCRAELIDADGQVIQSWHDPNAWHWSNCELLPNGDLLVVGSEGGERASERMVGVGRFPFLIRYTWDGRVVWRQAWNAHHDVEVTPQNDLTLLLWDRRQVPDLPPGADLLDDRIARATLDGELLVWYSIYDMLNADREVFQFQQVARQMRDGQLEIDLLHTNSVEWMHRPELAAKDPIYAPSNVLVCLRHQDSIAIFDVERRKVVWAWGQGELGGPHDATVLANGHILLFDNGLGRGWSRVVELDPLARKIVWQYKAPNPEDFYSAARGSSQRLPNGNTLIAESDRGRVFEVTSDGQIVWEFYSPHFDKKDRRATIVRMKRYEPEYVQAILGQAGHAKHQPPANRSGN